MRFKDLFNINEEVEQIDPKDLADKIEKTMVKYFPNSKTNAEYTERLGKSIDGTFTLGKDNSEYAHGIMRNDPLLHQFSIYPKTNGMYDLNWHSYSMALKPLLQYRAMRHLNTGMRNKKNASSDEIIKAIDNSFKKLLQIVKDNKDNILPSDIELFKKKKLI